MPEQNSQSRRPHYHRSRRGSDRRGPDRRDVAPSKQEQGGRDQQDVDQIMREIRARISQRHGIELTTQQIQELAARRLEAILDPRTVNPSLLEGLRRNAGKVQETKAAAPAYEFEDRTIYESHNGLLRFMRRLLNPILKLFFNPNPISHALNAQAKLNVEVTAREAERDRRQAEWNALHYDILQRLVTETARVSIEMQSLSSRLESLNARVDFNDRRVRIVEASAQPSRPQHRQPEQRQAEHRQAEGRPSEGRQPEGRPPAGVSAAAAPEEGGATEPRQEQGAPGEGRRRRRRRRGRRSGGIGEAPVATGDAQLAESDADAGEGPEFDDGGEEDLAAPPERVPVPISSAPREEEEGTPSTEQPTAAAAPPPFPRDEEGAATTPPSPPRDEPAPPPVEPPADREPVDR